MLRLDFERPLTALEIRDPAVGVCREIAEEHDLYVTFDQPQQPAFGVHSGQRGRQRIGNGNHNDWYINYQVEEPRVSHPTIIGRIVLRAPVNPSAMQFGGFDYGRYEGETPRYGFITVHAPSELDQYRPIDPSPEILEMTYAGLKRLFVDDNPRLFSVEEYTV